MAKDRDNGWALYPKERNDNSDCQVLGKCAMSV